MGYREGIPSLKGSMSRQKGTHVLHSMSFCFFLQEIGTKFMIVSTLAEAHEIKLTIVESNLS